MRKLLAYLLRRLAEYLYPTDHAETVEVTDEYGICRCRVEVRGDALHGIEKTFELLPDGWHLGEQNVVRPDPY